MNKKIIPAVLSGMDFSSGHPTDSLQLWFKQMPASGGQYNIILFPGANGLAENEMGLRINMPSGNVYTSAGVRSNEIPLPPANAIVSVTGGKIKVAIPQMMLVWRNTIAMTQDSSIFFGGVLIEK